MHRPHCNVLQRSAAPDWNPQDSSGLVAALSETRLLQKNRFLAVFAAGIACNSSKNWKAVVPLPLAGTTSRRGTFGSQRRAAETCAQALRFRCVEGVAVAGEILPRPPSLLRVVPDPAPQVVPQRLAVGLHGKVSGGFEHVLLRAGEISGDQRALCVGEGRVASAQNHHRGAKA